MGGNNRPGLGDERQGLNVPDAIGVVTGYRWWNYHRVEKGGVVKTLWATSRNFEWSLDGVTEAHCGSCVKYVPKMNHTCGLYSIKDARFLPQHRYGKIAGRVELWGKIVEHSTGWRAQYARITGVFDIVVGIPEYVPQRFAEYHEIELLRHDEFSIKFREGSIANERQKFKVGDRVKHSLFDKVGVIAVKNPRTASVQIGQQQKMKRYSYWDLEKL